MRCLHLPVVIGMLLANAGAEAAAQLQVETTVGKASVYCTVPGEPNQCSPPPSGTDSVQVEPGEDVVVAYIVQNTGDTTFTAHTLVDSVRGVILSNFPYVLEPATSAFITQRFAAPLTAGLDVRSGTWTGSASGGGSDADTDWYAIDVIAPQFTLRAGVAPATAVCPDPNDLSGCTMPVPNSVEFVAGQRLAVGYEITNQGSYALPTHTLIDPAIGTILSNFPYQLAPAASAFIVQFHTPTGPTANSGTWTITTTYGATASRTANYTIFGPLFADGFE